MSALIPIGLLVALAGGLIFWVRGSRILKPLTVLGGVLAGAALGLGMNAIPPLATVAPVWPIFLGAALGGLLAWMTFRLLLGTAAALTLAVLAPMAFFAWAQHRDLPSDPAAYLTPASNDPDPGWPQSVSHGLEEGAQTIDLLLSEAATSAYHRELAHREESSTAISEPTGLNSQSAHPISSLRNTLRASIESSAESWRSASATTRSWTLLVAMIALIVGFAGGFALPQLLGALLTASCGATVVLLSGFALSERLALPLQALGPSSPRAVAIWWLSATLIGLAVQLHHLGRRKQLPEGTTAPA